MCSSFSRLEAMPDAAFPREDIDDFTAVAISVRLVCNILLAFPSVLTG